MNLRYHYVAIVVLIICSTVFLFARKPGEYDSAKELIAFRKIGHELLLSVKDSTSGVLPVNKISKDHFRLAFERPFTLVPDSLVGIVNRLMTKNDITGDYVVTVVEPATNIQVYGFSVSTMGDIILPCLGRVLPEKRYAIDIIFKTEFKPLVSKNDFPFITLLLAIGLSGTVYIKKQKNAANETKTGSVAGSIQIGEYAFYPDKSLLVHSNISAVLTQKENKLLQIFTKDMNQVIDRNRLLKEGWEDEGVITQRSLDMYVSRLRKKMIGDPGVKITNVHGKGYCLQC